MLLDKRRILCCGMLIAALWGGGIVPSRAQATPPLSKEAKENIELMEAWGDLGTLRVLTPLKLTGEQMDKMIALVSATETEHNQKVVALYSTSLQKMAADIRAAKKKALAGEEVTGDLAERLKKGMEAHLDAVGAKKQEELMIGTLKTLAPKVKAILNAEQIKAAAKIAQEEQEKITKGSKGSEAQWFNYYVQRVIMGYPRIVPLLKELKGGSSTTAAGVANTGGKE